MLRDSLRGFSRRALEAPKPRRSMRPRRRKSPRSGAGWSGRALPRSAAIVSEGGLREILVVMTELGRAVCPAPMWSAALANLGACRDCRRSGGSRFAAKDCMTGRRASRSRFGALDPDRQCRFDSRLSDGRASGLLRFVEVAGSCTHLVVAHRSEIARVIVAWMAPASS